MEEQKQNTEELAKTLLGDAIVKYLEGGATMEDVAQVFADEMNRIEQEVLEAEERNRLEMIKLRDKKVNETDFTAPISTSPLLNYILEGLKADLLPHDVLGMLIAFYLAQNHADIRPKNQTSSFMFNKGRLYLDTIENDYITHNGKDALTMPKADKAPLGPVRKKHEEEKPQETAHNDLKDNKEWLYNNIWHAIFDPIGFYVDTHPDEFQSGENKNDKKNLDK